MKEKLLRPRRWGLTLSLMLFVLGVIIAGLLIAGTIMFTLYKAGLLGFWPEQRIKPAETGQGIIFFGQLLRLVVFSSFLSLTLTWFFGKRALNPLRKVIDATRKVAAGDFSARVELKGVGDLQELSQSFNKMAQELSTTETLRSDFVNTFSHQFKTPLLAMQGFAELLEIGDLTACEQKEYAGIIVAESKRLAALATKTLMLSKYEHVEIITDKTSFRLDEQIRRTITSIEPQWLAKELDVSADLDEITMPGNEDLIQQIWLNLLDNAIKFSPQGGNIQLQLQQRSGKICFTIQDSGIGMSEQARAHCFDKFYQEDESHKTGNGLGLAIVKRIVDLHGGTVEVQSKPGQGSTFCVSL